MNERMEGTLRNVSKAGPKADCNKGEHIRG